MYNYYYFFNILVLLINLLIFIFNILVEILSQFTHVHFVSVEHKKKYLKLDIFNKYRKYLYIFVSCFFPLFFIDSMYGQKHSSN